MGPGILSQFNSHLDLDIYTGPYKAWSMANCFHKECLAGKFKKTGHTNPMSTSILMWYLYFDFKCATLKLISVLVISLICLQMFTSDMKSQVFF